MPMSIEECTRFMAEQVPVMDMMKDHVTEAKFQCTPIKSDGSSTEYYKIPPGATDLIDLIEYKHMSFSTGNIFKACYRLGEKAGNDALYDINKILFFAERMKQQIIKEEVYD